MNHTSLLEIQNKRAVLVGINKYSDPSIKSLEYSVADVKSVYEIFADSKRGQFNPANIRLLVDKSKDKSKEPIRSNVMSSIKSLAETAGTEDSILFFFSGHGIEKDGKSYLLPSDSRLNVLDDTAIRVDWIKETIKQSNARVKTMILDACHAGALIGKAESGRMSKGFQDSLFPAPEGFAILSSCKLNEVSYEWPEKGHGVFTYYLNEGLLGYADFDSDGLITISDASRYVASEVKTWAFEHGVQQSPTLEYTVSGDIVLVNVPEIVRAKPQVEVLPPKEKDPREFVTRIHLIKLWEENLYYSDWAPQICASLLKHVEPDQISEESGKYIFPHGSIQSKSGYYDVSFEYQPSTWELVDKIIADLSKFLWNKLKYDMSTRFDKKKNRGSV